MFRFLIPPCLSFILFGMLHAQPEKEPIRFAALRLIGDQILHDVTVRKIMPDAVSVIHSSGVVTIPFEKLSPEDSKTLGISKESTTKAREEKEAKRKADAESTRQSELLDTLASSFFTRVRGKVLQVMPKGILLTDVKILTGFYETVEGLRPGMLTHLARTRDLDKCFVLCDPSGLVDGAGYTAIVGNDGTYSYENTLGANVTTTLYNAYLPDICARQAHAYRLPPENLLALVKDRYDFKREIFDTPLP